MDKIKSLLGSSKKDETTTSDHPSTTSTTGTSAQGSFPTDDVTGSGSKGLSSGHTTENSGLSSTGLSSSHGTTEALPSSSYATSGLAENRTTDSGLTSTGLTSSDGTAETLPATSTATSGLSGSREPTTVAPSDISGSALSQGNYTSASLPTVQPTFADRSIDIRDSHPTFTANRLDPDFHESKQSYHEEQLDDKTHHGGGWGPNAGELGSSGVTGTRPTEPSGPLESSSDTTTAPTSSRDTTGLGSSTRETTDTGPASSTVGPHSSNLANIVDPRVQPGYEESSTTGSTTRESSNLGRDAMIGGAGVGAAGATSGLSSSSNNYTDEKPFADRSVDLPGSSNTATDITPDMSTGGGAMTGGSAESSAYAERNQGTSGISSDGLHRQGDPTDSSTMDSGLTGASTTNSGLTGTSANETATTGVTSTSDTTTHPTSAYTSDHANRNAAVAPGGLGAAAAGMGAFEAAETDKARSTSTPHAADTGRKESDPYTLPHHQEREAAANQQTKGGMLGFLHKSQHNKYDDTEEKGTTAREKYYGTDGVTHTLSNEAGRENEPSTSTTTEPHSGLATGAGVTALGGAGAGAGYAAHEYNQTADTTGSAYTPAPIGSQTSTTGTSSSTTPYTTTGISDTRDMTSTSGPGQIYSSDQTIGNSSQYQTTGTAAPIGTSSYETTTSSTGPATTSGLQSATKDFSQGDPTGPSTTHGTDKHLTDSDYLQSSRAPPSGAAAFGKDPISSSGGTLAGGPAEENFSHVPGDEAHAKKEHRGFLDKMLHRESPNKLHKDPPAS